MIQDNYKLLVEVGFVFSVHEEKWQEKFMRLVAYKKLNGDCSVPSCYPNDQQLVSWVGSQRNNLQNGVSRKHHKRMLHKIGFSFFPGDKAWLVQFDKLIEHKNEHGHCNVSTTIRTTLSSWVKSTASVRKFECNEWFRVEETGFVEKRWLHF